MEDAARTDRIAPRGDAGGDGSFLPAGGRPRQKRTVVLRASSRKHGPPPPSTIPTSSRSMRYRGSEVAALRSRRRPAAAGAASVGEAIGRRGVAPAKPADEGARPAALRGGGCPRAPASLREGVESRRACSARSHVAEGPFARHARRSASCCGRSGSRRRCLAEVLRQHQLRRADRQLAVENPFLVGGDGQRVVVEWTVLPRQVRHSARLQV